MDTLTWYKLKFATNPNRYALAIWKHPNQFDKKDLLEALNCFVISDFEPVANAIITKFNSRHPECKVLKLKDIPSDLIIEDDMIPMTNAYDKLESVINKQEAMQDLLLATLNAVQDGMSPKDLIRITINTLVLEKKSPGAGQNRMTRENYRNFISHIPTKEEIESLGLSTEQLASVNSIEIQ